MWLLLFILFSLFVNVAAVESPIIVAPQGAEKLDLQGGGSGARLGSFTISNSAPAGFRLSVAFVNGCKMRRFGGGGYVELNTIDIQTVAGTPLMGQWVRGGDCGTFAIDFPKPDPALPTSYDIEILGSWDAQGANILAGQVWEVVSLIISNVY